MMVRTLCMQAEHMQMMHTLWLRDQSTLHHDYRLKFGFQLNATPLSLAQSIAGFSCHAAIESICVLMNV